MWKYLEIHAKISFDLLCCKLQHLGSQRRLHADPESVVHHIIRIGQIAANSVVGTDHVGLTGQVAGEEQSGTYFVLVQVREQIQSGDGAVRF